MRHTAPLPTPSAADLPASVPSLHAAPAFTARPALQRHKNLAEAGIAQGATLLCAVSGGADAVALACLAALAAPRLQARVHMVCCDHGLRAESAAEARFVEALGHLLGLEVTTVVLTVQGQGSLEEVARKKRYAALEAVRKQSGASHILLAHHRRDLSEDMVLRLVRGTGWPGLGGMKAADPARHLLRPLLFTAPEDLRTVLHELHMPHCEDASNADTRFARNRVRHELLPLLYRENPGLDAALGNLSLLARIDEEYFAGLIAPVCAQCTEERSLETTGTRLTLSLPARSVKALAPSVRLRLFMTLIQRLARAGVQGQARSGVLLQLNAALDRPQRPRHFVLPGRMQICLGSKALVFSGLVPNETVRQGMSNFCEKPAAAE